MKKLFIALGVVALIALTAVFVFSGGEEASPPINEETETPQDTNNNSNSAAEIQPSESDDEYIADFTPPAPTAEDITESITGIDEESEEKFLPPVHQKELKGATLAESNIPEEKARTYTLEWDENEETQVSNMLPDFPDSLPLYAIDRKTDESAFSIIKKLRDELGITGAVTRRKENIYSVSNIQTGEFFLHFNLYHYTFHVPKFDLGLEITEEEDPLTVLRSILQEKGLLQFENVADIQSFAEEDTTWVRFTPKFDFPLLSLEDPNEAYRSIYDAKGNKYLYGQLGYVDVEIDEANSGMISLYHFFPNIREEETVSLLGKVHIREAIEKGEFHLGKLELKYPGALSLEDRSTFYENIQKEDVEILEAIPEEVECGYFVHDRNKVQHFIAPVCKISGTGKVGGKSTLFEMILPIVE